jgi:transcriptional regulator with XRE-family HTH domain
MQKTIFSEEHRILLWHMVHARKKAGLTQEEVAKRLQTSRTWVTNCEVGERRIDAIELRAYCKALGISFADFIRQVDAAIEAECER